MYNNLLYIGCGFDITPLLAIESKVYTYIDGIPLYPFGYRNKKHQSKCSPKELDTFKQYLINILHKANYELSHHNIDQSHLQFKHKNSHSICNYIYSTTIDSEIPLNAIPYISGCDAIAIIGHIPHKSILSFLPSSIDMIGTISTYYSDPIRNPEDVGDKDSLDESKDTYMQFLDRVRTFKLLYRNHDDNNSDISEINYFETSEYQSFLSTIKSIRTVKSSL